MRCPACLSENVSPGTLPFHRLSFVQYGFRNPFPKKQLKRMCHDCGHIWVIEPYIDVKRFSLPEVFHHPKYNSDPTQVQSEKYFADRLIDVIKRLGVNPVDCILDLRMLSGRTLQEAKNSFSTSSCVGFDWHSESCTWAEKQYGHTTVQYPTADPLEGLQKWFAKNPEYKNKFDIIIQSQSILEFTQQPRLFVDLVLKLLRPGGRWAIYEQFIDMFPQEVFLHELFDPWAHQYFSASSFEQIFTGQRVAITKEFTTTTRRMTILESCALQFVPTERHSVPMLSRHPTYEDSSIKRVWQGHSGKLLAALLTRQHKVRDRLNLVTSPSRDTNVTTFPNRSSTPVNIDSRPTIDVLIVSCGRVVPLQKTIKYFQKMCHSGSRQFRFIIHDDWIDSRAKEHTICRQWIKDSKLFDEIHFSEENRGISQSVNFLLSRIASDLYVHLEDDMIFIRPIDFDPLFDIFLRYQFVNQIRFNRTQNTPLLGSVSKIFGKYRARMFKFDETILCLASFWSNQANISRSISPFTHLMNDVSGRFHERIFNVEFAKEWLDPFDAYCHLGAFIYGPVGNAKVVYESGNFSPHSLTSIAFPEDNETSIQKFKKKPTNLGP